MAEPEINKTLSVLLKQTQSIITFIYLSMVGVGMLYYHQKYTEFGINIFQYADIFYFLLAPFEDSFIFKLCGLAVVLIFFSYWFDRYAETRYPRFRTALNFGLNKLEWFDRWQRFVWIFSLFILIIIYSEFYGEKSRDTVLESEPVTVVFAEGQTRSGQMIGKTNDMLFLLEAGNVKVIPLNSSVLEITIGTFVVPGSDLASKPKPKKTPAVAPAAAPDPGSESSEPTTVE